MRPRLIGLENSHNSGKAQLWLCMCQMCLQPQGRKPTIKSLMICFDCYNKWIIGSKAAARVSEEGITERARFALSQRAGSGGTFKAKKSTRTKPQTGENILSEKQRAQHI